MNVLGLITARGGSKSIPRKNVVAVGGKPLIAWTIEAAKASRLTEVLVSTDDPEIKEVSQRFGAAVPFVRPAELAGDASPHIEVVIHALEWVRQNRGGLPEYLMLLQPTSPLRSAEDIDAVLDLAEKESAPAVVSVIPVEQHPLLLQKELEDGSLAPFMDSDIGYLRRQDLPRLWAPNGAIYLVRAEILLTEKTFWPKGARAYVMAAERSLDVDSPWDMHLADLVLRDDDDG